MRRTIVKIKHEYIDRGYSGERLLQALRNDSEYQMLRLKRQKNLLVEKEKKRKEDEFYKLAAAQTPRLKRQWLFHEAKKKKILTGDPFEDKVLHKIGRIAQKIFKKINNNESR